MTWFGPMHRRHKAFDQRVPSLPWKGVRLRRLRPTWPPVCSTAYTNARGPSTGGSGLLCAPEKMAATSLPLPNAGGGGNPNFDGNPATGAAAMPPAPGTDMTGICFRDQLWLNTYPLDRNLVFDYFALSPFYDWTCNNEQLRLRSTHPLDATQLSKMTGNEYMLSEVTEPHLFVMRKQKRDGPEKVTPLLTYYILDGSIYQAPQLCNVFAARIGRSIYHISKAFTLAASKLEKIGYDADNESATLEPKVGKEAIDVKEVMRVDHILAQLQRKLPPAPPPPPFPDGFVPLASAEPEKGPEDQQAADAWQNAPDPIIDQGPAKRLRY